MELKKNHIYLANLNPGFRSEPGKTRPVVVVQTDLLNTANHGSTIICPLTTDIVHESDVLRVHLEKGEAGLDRDGDILVDQIRSIDNSRFQKELGELPEEKKENLEMNLKIILDVD